MAEPASSEATGRKIEAALAHLQPIRDLAKNWDIDIASCLEDYLNELVGHFDHVPSGAVSEEKKADGENAPPNFAQAAILLQNSSNVYSRKVEYLYSLVYAALDDLFAPTGQKKQQTSRGPNTDAAIDEFNAFDPDMEFLLLDDVLPTDDTEAGDKINLSEDDDDDHLFLGDANNGNSFVGNVSHSSANAVNGDTTHLSLGGLSVTRLDRSSMLQGAALPSTATATRALMGTIFNEGSDSAGGTLRLLNGRCDVSDNGVLLMPGSAMLGNIPGSARDKGTNLAEVSGYDFTVDPNGSTYNKETAMPMDNGSDFAYDDDDHGDGVGFEFAADEDHVTAHREQMNHPTANPASNTSTKPRRPKADPWSLLDPHDAGSKKPRQLRIGTTYRLPPGLDEPPSSYVTGAHTRRTVKLKPSNQQQRQTKTARICIAAETFKATMAAANEKRKRESLEESNDDMDDELEEQKSAAMTSVPLKGLLFGNEFAYVAKAEAKRKAAERRERRKLMAENPTAVASEEADNLLGFDDDPVGGGDFDFGPADDDSFGGDHADDADNHDGHVGNTGIATIDDAFSSGTGDTTNVDATTFEALCRAHIKAFARGAEKYAAETNLTKRVGNWQSKLAPILKEEERRSEFDIHKYGDHIINTMKAEIAKKKLKPKKSNDPSCLSPQMGTNVVDFHIISRNCEQYEVCRLFLASLMLSNSGNVALDHVKEGNVASSAGSLQIELLDSEVDKPMETYLAPSAVDQEVVAIQ